MDLRYGQIRSHERVLDLRRGVLERHVEWCSPAGAAIRLHSTRLVSLQRRSIVAIRYRVEPVDTDVRIVVQSELVANEELPPQSADPRVAKTIEHALTAVEQHGEGLRALLVHRTEESRLQMAAIMDHRVEAGHELTTEIGLRPDWARATMSTRLACGERFELTKFVAYGWSSQRSVQALRDQVSSAIVSALDAGWDGVVAEQEDALEEFWDGADVEIDGPVEIQQAVRFGVFHSFQAAARAEQRAVPAKGLTGPGYDGHAFWDTEMFVLPLLSATAADAAADALRWRHSTMDLGDGAGEDAAARRRGLPVADDPRARSARRTGRPAPPRSTSTPTSRSLQPGTSGGPATRTSSATVPCRYSSRPPGCGWRWAMRARTSGSTSTA